MLDLPASEAKFDTAEGGAVESVGETAASLEERSRFFDFDECQQTQPAWHPRSPRAILVQQSCHSQKSSSSGNRSCLIGFGRTPTFSEPATGLSGAVATETPQAESGREIKGKTSAGDDLIQTLDEWGEGGAEDVRIRTNREAGEEKSGFEIRKGDRRIWIRATHQEPPHAGVPTRSSSTS